METKSVSTSCSLSVCNIYNHEQSFRQLNHLTVPFSVLIFTYPFIIYIKNYFIFFIFSIIFWIFKGRWWWPQLDSNQ